MKIDPSDEEVSVAIVNKKIEAFVQVLLSKLVEQQSQIADLKKRVIQLEGRANG